MRLDLAYLVHHEGFFSIYIYFKVAVTIFHSLRKKRKKKSGRQEQDRKIKRYCVVFSSIEKVKMGREEEKEKVMLMRHENILRGGRRQRRRRQRGVGWVGLW